MAIIGTIAGIIISVILVLGFSFLGAIIVYLMEEENMEQKKQTTDFKPTKAEIRAINHYWEEAMRNAKGAKNRAQRRKNHARG